MSDAKDSQADPQDVLLPGTEVFPETENIEYKSLKQSNGLMSNLDSLIRLLDREDENRDSRSPGVKKVMNAMFNTNGGTIYLGVEEAKRDQIWKVEDGLKLDKEARDRIKKCVCRIFGHFHPGIGYYTRAYEVKFIPVSKERVRIAILVDSSKRPQGVYHFISDDKSVAYERIGTSCEQIRSSMITRHSTGNEMIEATIDANLISHIRSIYNTILTNLKESNQLQMIAKVLEPIDAYIMFDHPRLPVKRAMISVSEHILTLTRHGLSRDVIYAVTDCLDRLVDPLLRRTLHEKRLDNDSEILLSECYLVIAYDGIKYRRSSDIFQMGVPRLALMVPYVKEARDRYQALFQTIRKYYSKHPDMEKYIEYLQLTKEYYQIRFECNSIGKPRTPRAEKIEDRLYDMDMKWI
jgi:hypothetical protein